jgi:beta-glucosidase
MTLFHFTLPIWFARKGGFERRANVRYFVEFVDRILEELGPSVRYIITINEPETYTYQSYITGEWPPQRHKKLLALRVYRNLALAHNHAARVIHQKSRKHKVSVAKNSMFVYPGDDAWLSRVSASVGQFIQDDYFLRQVYKTCDFLGVNYYMDARIYGYRMHNPQDKVNDLGWDMEPQNIELVLKRLHDKYHLPIMITENGVADATDQYRKWWLTQTIVALQKAMDSGVEVFGYLHWSLLDNFEWDKGTWPRFGLFAVLVGRIGHAIFSYHNRQMVLVVQALKYQLDILRFHVPAQIIHFILRVMHTVPINARIHIVVYAQEITGFIHLPQKIVVLNELPHRCRHARQPSIITWIHKHAVLCYRHLVFSAFLVDYPRRMVMRERQITIHAQCEEFFVALRWPLASDIALVGIGFGLINGDDIANTWPQFF